MAAISEAVVTIVHGAIFNDKQRNGGVATVLLAPEPVISTQWEAQWERSQIFLLSQSGSVALTDFMHAMICMASGVIQHKVFNGIKYHYRTLSDNNL